MTWLPKKEEINRAVRGPHPIIEGMRREIAFETIYILRAKQNKRLDLIETKAHQLGIPVRFVGPEAFSPFGKNHQSIFALLKKPSPVFDSIEELLTASSPGLSKNPKLYLVLDGITDPHNLGAISRTAFYFGAQGIILPKKGSVGLNDTVHKTSSGASLMLAYCMVGSLKLAIKELKDKGLTIYATEVEGRGTSLKDVSFSDPLALILGSEGRGIGKNVLPLADETINIDSSVSFESLNVSVAAGIILYEFSSKNFL